MLTGATACSNKADHYDAEDWAKQVIKYTSEQLVEHLGWMGVDWVQPNDQDPEQKKGEGKEEQGKGKGKEIRVLDYACGPGTVSAVRPLSLNDLSFLWH